jgi:hypothetical protein
MPPLIREYPANHSAHDETMCKLQLYDLVEGVKFKVIYKGEELQQLYCTVQIMSYFICKKEW